MTISYKTYIFLNINRLIIKIYGVCLVINNNRGEKQITKINYVFLYTRKVLGMFIYEISTYICMC